jgi:hypothetical protein
VFQSPAVQPVFRFRAMGSSICLIFFGVLMTGEFHLSVFIIATNPVFEILQGSACGSGYR